jgi:hypothetical protein
MGTKKAHINITIDEDLNEWLDKMAAESGMNKSHFINNVLSVARDDVKIYKAFGLFGLAKAAIRFKEECSKVGIKLKGISWRRTKKETA